MNFKKNTSGISDISTPSASEAKHTGYRSSRLADEAKETHDGFGDSNQQIRSQWLFITRATAAAFISFILIFALMRLIFSAAYVHADSVSSFLSPLLHGLPMDCSVAGYLTIIPFLLSIFAAYCRKRYNFLITLYIYYSIISLICALVFIADLMLYGYWGFRLDVTPIFYFTSSPASAMASASWWQLSAGLLTILLSAILIWLLLRKVTSLTFSDRLIPRNTKDNGGTSPSSATQDAEGNQRPYKASKAQQALKASKALKLHRVGNIASACGISLLLGGILFLAIRGGITVSTMHPGRAYFSDKTILNHAAINPLFSLLYSATHQEKFDKMYAYFDDAEAYHLAASLDSLPHTSSIPVTLTDIRPDIYIIILESFSNHLFPSLGGEAIANHLDSVGSNGIFFTDCYASGFRTDRGIPAIISGWPSAPTTSIMKTMNKAEQLPGLAEQLSAQAGYSTAYYYGGDANFTNMQAYLISAGFNEIISDKDFPLSSRLSKWGAHDDVLFNRILSDIRTAHHGKRKVSTDVPLLTVVQTSSSHEPFEVPYNNRKFSNNARANSFAFADSVAADFIKRLPEAMVTTRSGRKSLILLIADHWGAYPEREKLNDIFSRHRIPFIITGDALYSNPFRITFPVSQTDLAATLLGMLGLDHSPFAYSHNLFAPHAPYAWMSDKDEIALVCEDGKAAYNIEENSNVIESDTLFSIAKSKAFLQTLYRNINSLSKK